MAKKGRGRPRSPGTKAKTNANQARGSRKRGKEEIDANAGTPAARAVVQWLWEYTTNSMVAIAMFCSLDYGFVKRWANRDTAETSPGRGPKHVIPDSELPALRAKVENKRFHSAAKLRGEYPNPHTGKPCSVSTPARALERSSLC